MLCLLLTVSDDVSCRFTPDTSLALKASPYLFPCTIEYSVIAAAILYKMYRNVGRRYPRHLRSTPTMRTSSLLDRENANTSSGVHSMTTEPVAAVSVASWVQNECEGIISSSDAISVVSHAATLAGRGRSDVCRTSSTNRGVVPHTSAVDCDKANKGLFVGLFVTVLTLVAVSCYFVFEDTMPESELSSITFFCTEIFLLFALCVGVVLAFVKCQQLSFVPKMAEQVSRDWL